MRREPPNFLDGADTPADQPQVRKASSHLRKRPEQVESAFAPIDIAEEQHGRSHLRAFELGTAPGQIGQGDCIGEYLHRGGGTDFQHSLAPDLGHGDHEGRVREYLTDSASGERSGLLLVELQEFAAVEVHDVGSARRTRHQANDGLSPE